MGQDQKKSLDHCYDRVNKMSRGLISKGIQFSYHAIPKTPKAPEQQVSFHTILSFVGKNQFIVDKGWH